MLVLVALTACSRRGVTVGGPDPGTETSDSGDEWSDTTGVGTETSSTSTTDEGTSEEETTAGCGFIGCHDIPPPFECDPFDQDCPDGEKCVPVAVQGPTWDEYACVPVMGAAQPGEPCVGLGDQPGFDGEDDCELGAMCWDVDADTGEGWCVAQCKGTWDDPQCPDGEGCYIFSEGVPVVCLPQCDPLASDCVDGRLCVPDPYGQFFCVPDTSKGVGVYGAGCQYPAQCNAGLICLDETYVPGCISGACCTPYCDVTKPDDCPDQDLGMVCTPYYEEGNEPPGLEHVGVCVIP